MNYEQIKLHAQKYVKEMTTFLRDLVRIPGESCHEKNRIDRIAAEMKKLAFDEIHIDPMGNLLGFMGSGKKLICFDAHIDTVGIGNQENWAFDPYIGYESTEEIGGRGTSDQLGGIVSAVYATKLMKEFSLLSDDYQVLVTATVQEEDCDGLCWQYIINEDLIQPEFVVITEPTDGMICRGQRGRMEICVKTQGISCHGSAPERGDNAIYKMAEIVSELKELNNHLTSDDFLGKGTLTVSEISSTSPSRCAVADSCTISIDRRLTLNETKDSALEEIRQLTSVKASHAHVSMYEYSKPSYRSLVYPTECYFPAWITNESHPAVRAVVDAYKRLYGEPVIGKWTFSTNAVAIMGRYHIPCVGFGPGNEAQAHAPNEHTQKADLIRCAAVYALIPSIYCGR